jgi:Raf kinase inhibitor-like YbhB/YbcL family protein
VATIAGLAKRGLPCRAKYSTILVLYREPSMRLESSSFTENAAIPAEFAFAAIANPGPIVLSDNRNPHLRWSDVPEGTRSFALIVNDPDVPSVGDDVNQAGRSVPHDLPRVDFCHWLLANLPGSVTEISAGQFSDGVTARGKSGNGPFNTVQGLNDYTGWFAGDADMAGDYHGYDGPCPPWNDERMHHYTFTVYALSIEQLILPDRYTASDLQAAMAGHILATASLTGRYTLNPAVAY